MRDHRAEMTAAEREAEARALKDITRQMAGFGPQMKVTPIRAARRAKNKQQRSSRKANRP